jgi:hypothetical protein
MGPFMAPDAKMVAEHAGDPAPMLRQTIQVRIITT